MAPNATQGLKKGSLWRLTPQAIRDGVISTTRYRRDPKRKPERRGLPALKRQISGAKGGAATRAASHAKRLREAHARSMRMMPLADRHAGYCNGPEANYLSPAPMRPAQHSPRAQLSSPSPYFINSMDASPVVGRPPFSDPHTPPQLHLGHDAPEKGILNEFELQHIDYSNGGLFGNVDDNHPYTPSLITEASFFTDEGSRGPTSEPAMMRM